MGLADLIGEPADHREVLKGLAIMTAILVLPLISPAGLGWLISFVPLPVFYFLVSLGKKQGSLVIRNACLLAGGAAAIFGSLPLFVFILTLLPLGFVYLREARQENDPIRTALHGIAILTATWLLFWMVAGMIHRINPYETLLESADSAISAMEVVYQETGELPAEVRENISLALQEVRKLVPIITPALLLCGIILTVWANQALGNWLLRRKNAALAPWPEFMSWQLPDSLVWLGIISGGLVLLFSGPLNFLGINVLIVLGALYFIQGLAVVISLLKRWAVPPGFKVLIYILIILQSYGIILVAGLGLGDVWGDFRRLSPSEEETPPTEDK